MVFKELIGKKTVFKDLSNKIISKNNQLLKIRFQNLYSYPVIYHINALPSGLLYVNFKFIFFQEVTIFRANNLSSGYCWPAAVLNGFIAKIFE